MIIPGLIDFDVENFTTRDFYDLESVLYIQMFGRYKHGVTWSVKTLCLVL